jgi:hypothetical protein
MGLCVFIDEHEDAVRRDLLDRGFRLSQVGTDDGMSWRDLLAFVREAPQGTAIFRASLDNEEDAPWTIEAQLLAAIADGIHVLAWQNSGGSRADKPKPIERPGFRPEKRVIRGDVLSIDELSARLGMAPLF